MFCVGSTSGPSVCVCMCVQVPTLWGQLKTPLKSFVLFTAISVCTELKRAEFSRGKSSSLGLKVNTRRIGHKPFCWQTVSSEISISKDLACCREPRQELCVSMQLLWECFPPMDPEATKVLERAISHFEREAPGVLAPLCSLRVPLQVAGTIRSSKRKRHFFLIALL